MGERTTKEGRTEECRRKRNRRGGLEGKNRKTSKICVGERRRRWRERKHGEGETTNPANTGRPLVEVAGIDVVC